MNMKKIFSYHIWQEKQGEAGMRFLGVKIEGNHTYSVFQKIPDRDLYHITFVILGKTFDFIYKKGNTEGSLIKRLWK